MLTLGTVYKLINMSMNTLPFALLIWGFYTMVYGIIQADNSYDLHSFLTQQTCSTAADTFYNDCRVDTTIEHNIQVVDITLAQEDYMGMGVIFVSCFSLINVAWIGLFVKNGGMFSQSWGTIGYHALNVKSMRQSSYKYLGYTIATILACMSFYGLSEITNEEEHYSEAYAETQKVQTEKMIGLFANGLFQCVIGLVALITPVPDTIEYGDNFMNCKVKSQPWTTSRDVMEKVQDAVAAARGGENGYLKELTGCSDNDIDKLLSDVKAIPFEVSFVTKVTNFVLCKGGDEKNDNGGANTSPRNPHDQL